MKNIKWLGINENNLWYILQFLIEFVMKFSEYDVYHSDLKNRNIVVIFDFINRPILKIIDLGVASIDF